MKKIFRKNVHQLPVIVQEDVTGGFWVSCPTLEGCYSQGDSIEEALENIKEAILLTLEDLPRKSKKLMSKSVSLHLVKI